MLAGKRFRLERATLAVDVIDGKRTTVLVPVGTIIRVLSASRENQELVDVVWDNRKLQMFAVDVDVRGTEIKDAESERRQSHKKASGGS